MTSMFPISHEANSEYVNLGLINSLHKIEQLKKLVWQELVTTHLTVMALCLVTTVLL